VTQISRTQAWCKLAVLIADGAPPPLAIRFQGEESDDTAIVAVQAESSEDFDAWAGLLGCRRTVPRQLATDGSHWILTGHGDWNGWAVSLCAYPPIEPEPEPVAEDLTSVRAIAGAVSE